MVTLTTTSSTNMVDQILDDKNVVVTATRRDHASGQVMIGFTSSPGPV